MVRILRLLSIIGLAAVLTGCFRQAEESFEPVTLDTPATSDGATGLPIVTAAATTTQPLLVTVAATDTPDARTDIPPTEIELTDTPAQIFITPGAPQNTMVAVTDTPTLGTPMSPTPGGLITPTDFFNAETSGDAACEYEVKSGDTLFRIALNYDTTVAAIREASGLTGETIFPGDILIIPDCGEDDETAEQPEGTPGAGPTALPDGWKVHIVASGETLGLIAQRYSVGQSRIVAANQLANPDSLSVGQSLVIPAPEE
jgi:LysM repeat protein